MGFIRTKTKEETAALSFWDEYYKNLQNTDVVDNTESEEEIDERRKRLEADPEAWFKYYFEKYCTSEPAPFHKRSTIRVLNNPEWYEVRPWSRGLSKSGRTMMEMMYLHLTGKKKFTLLISATKDAAVRLLKPYKLAFEKNQRIIHDYGKQETFGSWAEDDFTTLAGNRFIAVGAGVIRGIKSEELRPDSILMDDFDTDEECRNPDIVDKKWEWFEQAVYGTRDTSKPLLVIFCGNIIADNCCVKKAIKICDKYEIVNIRDEHGKSTWPDKNTEEWIDRSLSKISAASAQKEYFNNPIVLGKVFKKLEYGKMQTLKKYKYLVAYTDPSYKKNADYKATALIGKWKDEYHVLWVRCSNLSSTRDLIEWQFEVLEHVGDATSVYLYIEWPAIDDTIKREIKKANRRHNRTLNLKPDERDKPDKFFRIESNLEPLNSQGKLIFNEEIKDNPHMKEMEFQFLALSAKSKAHDDGPDAVEGGVWVINHKNKQTSEPPKVYKRKSNSKRH